MVTASVLAVVLGAIFSLSETTAKLAPNDDERTLVVDEARSGLRQITRDARQARSIVSISDYSLRIQESSQQVTFTCNVAHPSIPGRSRCTRQSGAGNQVVIVDHLVNAAAGTPVFSRDGSFVTVRLRVATAGNRTQGHKTTVTLDDGAFVRNAAP